MSVSEPANSQAPPAFFPVLILLFIASGCSALIYEIVWFQLLQLVIGSSAVSLAVLLGTFMGGMCIGSLSLPHFVSARAHPLRVFACVELGIGLSGVLILHGMPFADRLYTASVGSGLPGILLRALVCGVCLLPPTILMGASLPAIARWVEATRRGVSWLGFFYGGNICGAVVGCLLAGFYLLRSHDMPTASYIAVAINAVVGWVALALATRPNHEVSLEAAIRSENSGGSSFGSVHLVIALSGLCALAGEVIWTRLLSLILGATVYAFSVILAVFLVGLGIGSCTGAYLARRIEHPRAALACCQFLLVGAIAWAAYILTRDVPYTALGPQATRAPGFDFQADLVRSLFTILPATCLWGASFPLALASVASPGRDSGRIVGGMYGANTIGAIVGAIGTGVLLIPALGTPMTTRLLMAFSALAGLLALAPVLHAATGPVLRLGWFALLISMGASSWLILKVPPVPWELVAYGRQLAETGNKGELRYVGEGMNASIAVTEWEDGARFFHVSGKVEASSEPQDMRLQRMLGHLPALLHGRPRSVLVVGFGSGVTAGSFVLHPGVERIVVCEIEPLIPRNVAPHFWHENHGVVSDPRVAFVFDDARHYILTTRERFDIITSDPVHPWVKGNASLYTKEYYDLCKARLNPGGIMAQWVPFYESNVDAVKSEIATFFEAFANGTIWGNDVDREGYDAVLLGWIDPIRVDVDELQRRLEREDHRQVRRSLREVSLGSSVDLLSTYAGRASDLRVWLKGSQINRDRNLRLQYLAGMGNNLQEGGYIYSDMLGHRSFPSELFLASPETRDALRSALTIP